MSAARAEPVSPAAMAGTGSDLKLWVCFAGLLVGQFMAVLDVQIVASSLTVIQTGVGATADEISWIQTCYLIAETLGIPLVGFCTRAIGLRLFFLLVCGIFTGISLVVGLTQDLTSLIVARTLQGFFGGLMLPIAFTYGFTAFPPALKSRISLILAMAAVLSPTVGPALGGYITDELGWRWLFFINILPGVAAMVMVAKSTNSEAGRERPRPKLDWPSFAFLSACLMSTQFVLEEGQRENWLESDLVFALILVAAVSGILFLRRSFVTAAPLLDLRLFGQHEFRAGTLLVVVGGLSLFGGSYMIPLFLAEVRHYSPLQIGETLLVSGVVMLVSGLAIVPRLNRLDLRIPIACGFAATGYGFWLGHEATAEWDYWEFAVLQAWRGVGVIVAITGTQTLVMSRVSASQASSATSLLFLARNLGGAVGIAVLSSTLVAQTRQAYVDTASGAAFQLPHLGRPGTAEPAARAVQEVALVLGFSQCFALVAVACAFAALLSLTLGGRRERP